MNVFHWDGTPLLGADTLAATPSGHSVTLESVRNLKRPSRDDYESVLRDPHQQRKPNSGRGRSSTRRGAFIARSDTMFVVVGAILAARPRFPVSENVGEKLTVVFAADELYAMALAVAVRSVLDNISKARPAQVVILDANLSQCTKQRLRDSWDRPDLRVAFVTVDPSLVARLPAVTGWSPVIYFRLLLPDVLPDSSRAIYLDADTITLCDLSPLWDIRLEGCPLAAAQEMYAPHVSSADGLRYWRTLGLSPTLEYFNSGVLVLDLAQWRREQLADRTIAHLNNHAHLVRYPDQDALNAVLAGRWRKLDPYWNVTRYWDRPHRRRGQYADILRRTRILHFLSEDKPWLPNYPNEERLRIFRSYLQRTEWRETRGSPRARSVPSTSI
jgi:lipopolysaccharide biosynthesis glycosyltransferase